ncbi:MAG: hypothetical protein ACRCX8_15505 [Sarcina sp.]
MFRQEVYLTTFEAIQTYGFIKIISTIWVSALVLGTPVAYMLCKTKQNRGEY